jgi:eukaryotic-like serine/threonine-protein kinase
MSTQVWMRVRELAGEALELPSEERQAFLASACGDDSGVRMQVQLLIDADQRADATFLRPFTPEVPRAALEHVPSATDPSWLIGSRIGHYRVKRLMGAGGMGAVYEAVDEDLDRTVAIKVLRSGLASRTLLDRFELEPRLLARLRHPGIAQIFEAGAVPGPDGEAVPFFAMELIPEATPIVVYASAQALSTHDRLRLFLKVCDAVIHGHQRSIIHRDLKPANILVDTSGQPKIIDFGIARATDSDAAVTTLAGELLGTIRYMSPEQCTGDPDDIDVRADVYALGVVLYELLAGEPPQPDPPGGIIALLREAPRRVPRPLSRFARHLCGDVETVALKAVEPDRASRYQSVVEFASDLARILRNEPISARPHTAAYQIRMFARRHRALVGGMCAIVAALALGIVGIGAGLIRARHAEHLAIAQSRRAQRIADFLMNTIRSADPQLLTPAVLRSLNPVAHPWETWTGSAEGWGPAGPADVGVAGVLLHAARHLESEFADDPDLHAEVALLLAGALVALETPQAAVSLAETAVQLLSRSPERDESEIIRARVLWAQSLTSLGRFAEADAQLNAALSAARTQFGPFDHRTLLILDRLNHNLGTMPGRFHDAVGAFGATIQAVSEAKGPDSAEAWLRHLQLILFFRFRFGPVDRSEFIAECRATVDGLSRALGPGTYPVALASYCLAIELHSDPAALSEAEALGRHALSINLRMFGPDHGNTHEARKALIGILLRQSKLADAAAMARENVDCSLRMIGPRSMYTLKAKAALARILTCQERHVEEAEHLAREAAEAYVAYSDPAEDFASYHSAIWAAALRLRNQPERAEEMLRERIALRGHRVPQSGSAWVEAYQYLQLALCLADQRRDDEARDALSTARAWAESLQDATSPLLLNVVEAEARLNLRDR